MDPQRMADYKNSHLMTVDEKQISFMNRYFVFRKTHNVNADKIYKIAQPEPEKEKEKPEPEKDKKEPPKVRKIQGKKVTIVGTLPISCCLSLRVRPLAGINLTQAIATLVPSI